MDIPELVRRRAEQGGAAEQAWLAGLDDLVAELAADWNLTLGPVLTCGSEAVVLAARTAEGREAVLKVLPVLATSAAEAPVLVAARGRGYAEVIRHDLGRNVVLLERLGDQLVNMGFSVADQIDVICGVLKEAWRVPPDGLALTGWTEKADALAAFTQDLWAELGKPCEARTVELALDYAARRRRAFDPARTVLAHGDAHPWNTLAAPGGGFKFVDPDGLLIEPAYELAIPMREWAEDLLAGDPVLLGRARCRQLAARTGVEETPIWEWGFMERVSTGLLATKLGMAEAADFLAVADAWALAA